MKPVTIRNEGFALVGALFLLVVLGGLGAMMVNLSSVQNSTVSMAVQGSRAYQASRAGLEWGAARAISGGHCSAATNFTVNDFRVTVTCSRQTLAESSLTYSVYRLQSTATFGIYGSPNFVTRRSEMSVADAS